MESPLPYVLLVDDDPMILRILSKSLEEAGYEVSQAVDGQEAWASIQNRCPDYLITDWIMPGLSGVELCRRVRQERLPHYLYILFLTAKSGSEDLIEALEAGADDFIAKPVSRGELLARLRAGQRVLQLERWLNEMARSDPLTGILTRRAFYEQFERELQRSRRSSAPLACVMLDVDYFKKVNDTHGHPAGDAILKEVARVLRDHSRAHDLVCRYGGEEFCVLLSETSESAGFVWAERLREEIARLRFPLQDTTLQVTASFGVAQLLDDTQGPGHLIDMADQALLVAKQAGRDRVIRYSSLYDSEALHWNPQHQKDPFAGVRARDVMTTLVACLGQDETVGKAAEFFLRFRINSSPVVDERGKLVGILSEKDVIGVMMSPDSWSRPIREVMKTSVVCYDEETSVKAIYDFLCRVTIRRVIIVKDGYPTGIISRGALLRWYSNWLAVHGQLPPGCGEDPVAEQSTRRQALAHTVGALTDSALRLQDQVAAEHDDFLPVLIDSVSRMQELINDLLADSRYFIASPGFLPDVEARFGQGSPAPNGATGGAQAVLDLLGQTPAGCSAGG